MDAASIMANIIFLTVNVEYMTAAKQFVEPLVMYAGLLTASDKRLTDIPRIVLTCLYVTLNHSK